GEASNGREAVEKGAALMPSVIVMDLSMPIMNGLEATRHLRRVLPAVKVLILTVHEKKEFASQVIEAGASGYICKNSPPSELVSAIESIHQGHTFFKIAGDAVETELPAVASGKRSKEDLSLREREVLTLIADGYSNKQTAGLLGVSVRTVEKHRERIMAKLKLHSVVELTKYAIANQMVHLTSVPQASP
ncbi:MAG: response regulator transcription factor, partial [Verrucomicrobiota bacterium]